jgi:hypothetical protein
MILKKTVIYFDYSLRLKDPALGNLYNDRIITLYGKIKVKFLIIFNYFYEFLLFFIINIGSNYKFR